MALVIAPWESARAQEESPEESPAELPSWVSPQNPIEGSPPDPDPEPSPDEDNINYAAPTANEGALTIQVWGGVSDVNETRQWRLIGTLSGSFESRPISEAINLDATSWSFLEFADGKKVHLDQIPLSWGSVWRYEDDDVRTPSLYGHSGGMPVHIAFITQDERERLHDETLLYPVSDMGTVSAPETFLLNVVASKPIAGIQNCVFPFAVTRVEVDVGFATINPTPLYTLADSPTSQDCYVYLSLGGPPPGEAFIGDTGNGMPIACVDEDEEGGIACDPDLYEDPSNDNEAGLGTSPDDSSPIDTDEVCMRLVNTYDDDGVLIATTEVQGDCIKNDGFVAGELPAREYPPLDDAQEGTMNILNLLGKQRFAPPTPEGEPEE